ncbi:unnamed protein product [Boreogadus saida]
MRVCSVSRRLIGFGPLPTVPDIEQQSTSECFISCARSDCFFGSIERAGETMLCSRAHQHVLPGGAVDWNLHNLLLPGNARVGSTRGDVPSNGTGAPCRPTQSEG